VFGGNVEANHSTVRFHHGPRSGVAKLRESHCAPLAARVAPGILGMRLNSCVIKPPTTRVAPRFRTGRTERAYCTKDWLGTTIVLQYDFSRAVARWNMG